MIWLMKRVPAPPPTHGVFCAATKFLPRVVRVVFLNTSAVKHNYIFDKVFVGVSGISLMILVVV